MSLPAPDLRSNLGTWAVPTRLLPWLAHELTDWLPTEKFDPRFVGQELTTTYFDTPNFKLRKARKDGDKYLTLRVRRYEPQENTQDVAYALSAKTETSKLRQEIQAPDYAEFTALGIDLKDIGNLLPPDYLTRLLDIIDSEQLLKPVVSISFRRYAVEDQHDRLTLDTDISTDTGKRFGAHILEYKSTHAAAYMSFACRLRPIKLSKFLWSTRQ